MKPAKFSLSIAQAMAALPGPDPENTRYDTFFKHGTAEVLVYAPQEVDDQEIHDQDEFYIVIKGTGKFLNNDVVHPFSPGDILFVPAGVEHRFIDFSDDISVWVILYGPTGGECPI